MSNRNKFVAFVETQTQILHFWISDVFLKKITDIFWNSCPYMDESKRYLFIDNTCLIYIEEMVCFVKYKKSSHEIIILSRKSINTAE